MPELGKLNQISLDDYKIVDNNTSTFVYFTYPTNDCKFDTMVTQKDGSYDNILKYKYAFDKPNVFISNNKNFTDLDEYTATSFAITQKIHTSTRLTKGARTDLELIIEHTPGPNNFKKDAKLYMVFFLTAADEKSKNGGDFDTIFKKLNTDNILFQTNDFETKNLAAPVLSIGLDSGIQGQFGQNDTNPKTNTCFTFSDTNKNMVVIMQPPIPIDSNNFQIVQEFMTKSETQVPFDSIFTKVTDLTPTMDPKEVTTNVLMKSKNDLSEDIQNNPQTPTQKEKDNKDESREENAKAAANVKQGFTTFGGSVQEGLTKYIKCRPSNSNQAPKAHLVSNKDPTGGSAAMQFLVNAMLFMGITLGMYMFAPGLYATMLTYKDEKFLMGILYGILGPIDPDNIQSRAARISLISWIIGIISVILFIILWSVGLSSNSNISDGSRNFMIVFSFLFVAICVLNTTFLKMTNANLELAKMIIKSMDKPPAINSITNILDEVFKNTSVYWFYKG